MSSHLMSTYNRQPVTFVRGSGARLWDEQGREYLDALSGIAVTGLGHSHPDISDAICEQASTLIHTSNVYGVHWQSRLADDLARISGMDRIFFGNSGAEANEAAIKLARLYGHQRQIDAPLIIVMETSFHGRTLATLTATGNAAIQKGFEPLVSGFLRVPYGDLAAIEGLAAQHDNIVAVLVEPVQGEGGVRPAPAGYLEGIRALCDRHDWLMMLDEVQTGIGRTGRWFAFQHVPGLLPDVMSLAKGLGNGVPIGACLAAGKAASVFAPGNHGSTFGGNPLVCRVAHTVIAVIERDQLLDRAAALSARIREGLASGFSGETAVREIRGQGLLIGIELDRPCGELVRRALDAGLLINVTATSVIRILPPLILSDSDADEIVARLVRVVRDWLAENAERIAD
ncbi:acetylornithine aminotransferase [Halothiobacillus diazotrophicus]|uniref:Acetylornithine aminotransferase n=1 Tax=Halothiobacillus diazotrophicus TaxID=1860122 RepID=A0A191ZFY7_9GAMM|nr:acetylornithine transaminase [Halothiobacillus diazotrophicus]ANJ66767.1 acetylornithine aminotransferase [Halothiobacillus diazotrophicus]